MKPLIIEGTAFPLEKLNRNKWGLADTPSVVESAINSLKTSKVRICPIGGDSEHSCDFSNDTASEIGNIVDAWREKDNIKVKLEITNENAINKFKSNEFGLDWSVYGFAKTLDGDGFIRDEYSNKSITFVNNPAWNSTHGTIVAASTEEKEGLQSYIELIASDTVFENFESENIMPNEENTDETKDESNETIEKLEQLYSTEKARTDELEIKLNKFVDNLKVSDEPEADADGESKIGDIQNGIPEDTVNSMIAAAIAQERETVKKEVAVENYKQICKTVGIEVKTEDLDRFENKHILAADITRELTSIQNVYSKYNKTLPGVSKEPDYTGKKDEKKTSPADYQNDKGWTVGIPENGDWK